MKPPPPGNAFKGRTGLDRIVHAGLNSWQGLRHAFMHESAFRQEVALSAVMLPLAIWLPVTTVERLLLIGSVLLVLIVELLNSGIEAAIDRISLERHPLSGLAKDLGSAAVLIALLLAGLVWILIAGPMAFGWLRI
jgi:diacylglycerol kinase (ATP)